MCGVPRTGRPTPLNGETTIPWRPTVYPGTYARSTPDKPAIIVPALDDAPEITVTYAELGRPVTAAGPQATVVLAGMKGSGKVISGFSADSVIVKELTLREVAGQDLRAYEPAPKTEGRRWRWRSHDGSLIGAPPPHPRPGFGDTDQADGGAKIGLASTDDRLDTGTLGEPPHPVLHIASEWD
jgi:hypothetical protein